MIRLLALLEAATITGPAKNLLEFARQARTAESDATPVEVEIATFRRADGSDAFLDAARAADICTHVIRERSALDFSTLERIRELVAARRPDILQTHAVKSHFLLKLSRVWKNIPWVAFHHGYTFTDRKMLVYNQLDRWSLRTPRRVVTVSRNFQQQLCRIGVNAGRIAVLHNAIDPAWGERASSPELRARTRAELKIEPDQKVALIVGRLSREKSHLDLLAAADRVKSVRLIIAGDGPERDRIVACADRLGIAERVLLMGHEPSIERLYAAADIAVLASVTEGSPNALLEAMAARVPVVATRVGGIPEIVTDGESALLVPPGDAEAMAAAMSRMLCEPALAARLSAEAARLAETRFSPQARRRTLTTIYQGVLHS